MKVRLLDRRLWRWRRRRCGRVRERRFANDHGCWLERRETLGREGNEAGIDVPTRQMPLTGTASWSYLDCLDCSSCPSLAPRSVTSTKMGWLCRIRLASVAAAQQGSRHSMALHRWRKIIVLRFWGVHVELQIWWQCAKSWYSRRHANATNGVDGFSTPDRASAIPAIWSFLPKTPTAATKKKPSDVACWWLCEWRALPLSHCFLHHIFPARSNSDELGHLKTCHCT